MGGSHNGSEQFARPVYSSNGILLDLSDLLATGWIASNGARSPDRPDRIVPEDYGWELPERNLDRRSWRDASRALVSVTGNWPGLGIAGYCRRCGQGTGTDELPSGSLKGSRRLCATLCSGLLSAFLTQVTIEMRRRLVREHYSVDRMVDAYESHYLEGACR